MFESTLKDEEKHIPPTIAAAPDLDPLHQFIYDGFFELGRSGMGGGPLHSEKVSWLDENFIISMADRALFKRCWKRMEPHAEELAEARAELESKSKGKGKSAPTMGSHRKNA